MKQIMLESKDMIWMMLSPRDPGSNDPGYLAGGIAARRMTSGPRRVHAARSNGDILVFRLFSLRCLGWVGRNWTLVRMERVLLLLAVAVCVGDGKEC